MESDSPHVLSTAFQVPPARRWLSSLRATGSILSRASRNSQSSTSRNSLTDHEQATIVDSEFKLPKVASLVIVLLASALLQLSFFIIISSSNVYAEHLGGSSTFSGLVIGIPTVFSGITLLPLMRLDQGKYKRPLHFACASTVLGHMLYGLAYKANFLYLILISRVVSGFGFTFWMYSKRYCSDHRIVGIRRRTTLAGWLVVGQATGFSLGPFLGGVLYKVGFHNDIFNGYTAPAWLMAGVWTIFWIFAALFFEDVPDENETLEEIQMRSVPFPQSEDKPPVEASPKVGEEVHITERRPADPARVETPSELPGGSLTGAQWRVTATMCWFAMTCFFILGAWESNIPVFTSSNSPLNPFHFSPFDAGNLIALGGACTFPFLFVNVLLARKYQDRNTLALGTFIGAVGLIITIAILSTKTVRYASLFMCWFLIALGFNLASTVTLSLLSKQLPNRWNSRISLFIQYSNYTGRVTGAVWGGAGVKVGMLSYVGTQIAIVGVGAVMFISLWKDLKAKTG